MIYGQGVPVAVLIGSDGLVVATVTLPRPTRRDANDFEELYLNLGPDTTNQDVTLYQGVRWHGKYVWTSHADNQADMATVRRGGKWGGGGGGGAETVPTQLRLRQAVVEKAAGLR